jgi:predicted transposase YdaD
MLCSRHQMLVRSDAILLRREADSRQLTGLYEEAFPEEEPYQIFRYNVVRVWQLPPSLFLTGGLAALPLAVISDVTEAELPDIIKRIEQRLSRRRARKQAKTIWAASFVLMGLRYSRDLATRLFQGVVSMKESSTYQMILEEGLEEGRKKGREEGREKGREEGREEGAVEEATRLLRSLGEKKFSAPTARTNRAIDQLADRQQIEEIMDRILTAKSWDELLDPTPPKRGRRRSE